jgi:hypothetical protein
MPNLPPLEPVLLTDSFQEIFTLEPTAAFKVRAIHMANTTDSSDVSPADVKVTVCVAASGENPTRDNAVLWKFLLEINDFIEFLEGDTWPVGSVLWAKCDVKYGANIKVTGDLM